jgi:hypothetical protein
MLDVVVNLIVELASIRGSVPNIDPALLVLDSSSLLVDGAFQGFDAPKLIMNDAGLDA